MPGYLPMSVFLAWGLLACCPLTRVDWVFPTCGPAARVLWAFAGRQERGKPTAAAAVMAYKVTASAENLAAKKRLGAISDDFRHLLARNGQRFAARKSLSRPKKEIFEQKVTQNGQKCELARFVIVLRQRDFRCST